MNRLLALVLAIVGGGIAAYLITLSVAAGLLGVLWIFVFGDDPWPRWTETVLGPAIVIAGLGLWLFAAWSIWLKLRPHP